MIFNKGGNILVSGGTLYLGSGKLVVTIYILTVGMPFAIRNVS